MVDFVVSFPAPAFHASRGWEIETGGCSDLTASGHDTKLVLAAAAKISFAKKRGALPTNPDHVCLSTEIAPCRPGVNGYYRMSRLNFAEKRVKYNLVA